MKALMLAMMMIAAPVDVSKCYTVGQELEFMEEHHLERVFLSCYLPTGNKTADGTVPYEGICSCNEEHLGMDCIMYDAKTLTPVARWECRDIGGNSLLKQGKAIDVFRTDMDRALQLKAEYGDYVYIEWIEREQAIIDGLGRKKP